MPVFFKLCPEDGRASCPGTDPGRILINQTRQFSVPATAVFSAMAGKIQMITFSHN